MNRKEIRCQAREWLDDEVLNDDQNGLWSNDELNRYLKEGYREAVLRARLLVDSTTAQITNISVVADQSSYTLDPVIIVAREVTFTSADGTRSWALDRISYDTLDQKQEYMYRRHSNWRHQKAPRPHAVIQDLDQRILRLFPIPTAPGTLELTVLRYPFFNEQLETDESTPVIAEHHHLPIAHWACYRALLKKDADTYDPGKSSDHQNLFTETFGPPITAQDIRRMAWDRAGEIQNYFF